MYSKHDTKKKCTYIHIHNIMYTYVHICFTKKKKKKVRTKSGETRSERDVEKERREREKMYTSKQLDPGSCPSLVSTIRSFVVLLIDTHSSSQFLQTVFSATQRSYYAISFFLNYFFSFHFVDFLFFNILQFV